MDKLNTETLYNLIESLRQSKRISGTKFSKLLFPQEKSNTYLTMRNRKQPNLLLVIKAFQYFKIASITIEYRGSFYHWIFKGKTFEEVQKGLYNLMVFLVQNTPNTKKKATFGLIYQVIQRQPEKSTLSTLIKMLDKVEYKLTINNDIKDLFD